ncbi:hypothetical protein C1645_830100 [Glomus cerebriforme]|uniref:Uncharacterized protein n=1 Tax=Glomus cerebriforme TaxID=658196 RepID=A0A397SIB6_9GLOM|nr:hypothetical protein C1645_830100 [Glomus cerebriforme]
MSEISTLVEPDLSDAQKKHTRESFTSKKVKKTGEKKVSSMLKKLIEELLTDVVLDVAGENLKEEIDSAESKNKDAS